MDTRLAIFRRFAAHCASCASRAVGAASVLAIAAFAIACSSSDAATDAGGTEAGVCSGLAVCCPMACDVNVCPEDAGSYPGTCFCDGDYQSPGPSCVARATAAYACMTSHKSDDGYVCTASGSTAFRCSSYCQNEIAQANAACGDIIPCAP